MKIAYFDTIAGISGDMTLAALVSVGACFDRLEDELKKLQIGGFKLENKEIQVSGISALKIDVHIEADSHHHRHYTDIVKIIESSSLSKKIKDTSLKIFYELAKAEAAVHNKSIEEVHFHEVGAIDSIVDIVGTVICLDILKIDKIFSSEIKLGNNGFVEAQHGKLPVPSPAVVEILKNYPVVLTDIPFELTTPTGAAIIKALSSGVLSYDKIKIEKIGYGAGTQQLQIPNLLRVMIAEEIVEFEADDLLILETNIDDMNPEIYPFLIERLIGNGANDAFLIPIIMKKGRPGILLSVLVERSKLDEIMNFIFRETTTAGIRIIETNRKKLNRESVEIDSVFGKIKVKVLNVNGKLRYVPEYEECKRIAYEKSIPIIEVYKTIEKMF